MNYYVHKENHDELVAYEELQQALDVLVEANKAFKIPTDFSNFPSPFDREGVEQLQDIAKMLVFSDNFVKYGVKDVEPTKNVFLDGEGEMLSSLSLTAIHKFYEDVKGVIRSAVEKGDVFRIADGAATLIPHYFLDEFDVMVCVGYKFGFYDMKDLVRHMELIQFDDAAQMKEVAERSKGERALALVSEEFATDEVLATLKEARIPCGVIMKCLGAAEAQEVLNITVTIEDK
ncbi:hypothetical protein FT641_18720 [Bacillus paranthracis]|uniref:hypothetical protein n=1 Tax=Bacillus paranthracis TaxID=2026186 RepID=UPI00187A64F5|nr:hypothetical protein [Bacillus paranthracis]MBE7114401.1 hypothetical protein [Bacillus paranthracis]MBE7154725.1 hypothetical protein [Bacillus paranthracis]